MKPRNPHIGPIRSRVLESLCRLCEGEAVAMRRAISRSSGVDYRHTCIALGWLKKRGLARETRHYAWAPTESGRAAMGREGVAP